MRSAIWHGGDADERARAAGERPLAVRNHGRAASTIELSSPEIRSSVIARGQPLNFWLLAACCGAGVGVLVDRSPKAAILAVALCALGAFVAQAGRLPATVFLAGAIVLSSALVDLPSKVQVGRFSANAGLTVAYALVGLVVVAISPRISADAAGVPMRAFMAFLALALLSVMWTPASISAAQNALVLLVFVISLFCGIAVAYRHRYPAQFVDRLFTVSAFTALGLYGIGLAAGGIGSSAVVGNRAFGLFAVVIVAWEVAGWRYGVKFGRALALVASALVLLSLSRTAFAAILIIGCTAWFSPRTLGAWLRLAATVCIAVGVGYVAVQYFRPLHDRFYTGDVRPVVGGVAINVEGRSQLWATTWHSYLTSPVLGHGVGSADLLIAKRYPGAGHPHNDYLRLLHDYGLVGGCLWLLGYVSLLGRCWRSWQRPYRVERNSDVSVSDVHRERRVHAAASLALIGVALAMITDNVIDYMFVMGPVGVLAGLSLGLEKRRFGSRQMPGYRDAAHGRGQ